MGRSGGSAAGVLVGGADATGVAEGSGVSGPLGPAAGAHPAKMMATTMVKKLARRTKFLFLCFIRLSSMSNIVLPEAWGGWPIRPTCWARIPCSGPSKVLSHPNDGPT